MLARTLSQSSAASWDAVIIGGGHNGLTCAAYLARAGQRTLVLEAGSSVGGFCRTEPSVAQAPGYLINTGAIDHIMTNVPPSVVDELELHREGLRYVNIDPLFTYISPDGACLPFWRDLNRTVREIRCLSVRDAQRYEQMVSILLDTVKTALPYLLGHPKDVSIKTIFAVARGAAKGRGRLITAAQLMLSSPVALLEEWFEREELRTAIGMLSASSLIPIDASGATGLLFLPIMHHWGVRRPIGGSGRFTEALAQSVRARGGVIRTSTPVEAVTIDGSRAIGVRTAEGEEIGATNIIGAVDPTTLLTRLIPPAILPPATQDELRGMQVLGQNCSCIKADIATASLPRFPRYGSDPVTLAQVMMAPDLSTIRATLRAASHGDLVDKPPVWIWIPSIYDTTLVPPGSDGHGVYLYSFAPLLRSDGRDWAADKDAHLDRCLNVVEEHAPGFKATVIGTHVTSPTDLAAGAHRGHMYHVDITLSQLGPARPTRSLAGYRTPIDGLWHTGAGAHPFPGLSGWSGRTTARTILAATKQRNRHPWHAHRATASAGTAH